MSNTMSTTIPAIALTFLCTLIVGLPSQQLTINSTSNNQYNFSSMLSQAESCRANNDSNQCYKDAFPQRCGNLAAELNFNSSSEQKKMSNCVSTCQQASIASRSFGACSIRL